MKTTRLIFAALTLAAVSGAPFAQQQQPKPPTAEQLAGQVQVLQIQLARSQEGEQALGARIGELITQLNAANDELKKLRPAEPAKK